MAKFLYSMQNVLDIKERLETQAKTEYAEMNNRLFIEEETMKRLGKRLDSYENLARSSASERLDIMEMRRCNEAIDIIKNQMTQQAVRIRIAQRDVDNAMKKLTEAVQDRKIHEKLKEKAFEQFKLDIGLFSKISDTPACHIYVIPETQLVDFIYYLSCELM